MIIAAIGIIYSLKNIFPIKDKNKEEKAIEIDVNNNIPVDDKDKLEKDINYDDLNEHNILEINNNNNDNSSFNMIKTGIVLLSIFGIKKCNNYLNSKKRNKNKTFFQYLKGKLRII